MKKYDLAICITTYNRESTVLKTVHRLLPFIENNSAILIVHADGGSHDLLDKLMPVMMSKMDGKLKYYASENEGVFKSKVRTITTGVHEANWIIHCDDDDYLDLNLLEIIIKNNLESFKYKGYKAIQFNVSRLLEKELELNNKLDYQVNKRKEVTCCLNGLLFQSEPLVEVINNYFDLDISTWSNKVESWGDDTLVPGALLSLGEVSDEELAYCMEILSFQEYVGTDYHICNDPEVYKRTKKYCHKYFRHVPLKNRL